MLGGCLEGNYYVFNSILLNIYLGDRTVLLEILAFLVYAVFLGFEACMASLCAFAPFQTHISLKEAYARKMQFSNIYLSDLQPYLTRRED